MLPKKPGGGNHLQLYDPNNGEYTNEEKEILFNKEMFNMVARYIFEEPHGTYFPQFPILNFHNKEYCELYVKHCINNINMDIPWEKITKYLLSHKEKNDKSFFFYMHGYSINKPAQLFNAIYFGSDFSCKKFQKIDEFGLTIAVPTSIDSSLENKKINIITYWKYSYENDYLHLITVNLDQKEYNKLWKK